VWPWQPRCPAHSQGPFGGCASPRTPSRSSARCPTASAWKALPPGRQRDATARHAAASRACAPPAWPLTGTRAGAAPPVLPLATAAGAASGLRPCSRGVSASWARASTPQQPFGTPTMDRFAPGFSAPRLIDVTSAASRPVLPPCFNATSPDRLTSHGWFNPALGGGGAPHKFLLRSAMDVALQDWTSLLHRCCLTPRN
jgi:hypothetical protein